MTIPLSRARRGLAAGALAALAFVPFACLSGTGSDGGSGDLEKGAARFGEVEENPRWYRTFDSASNIATETTLVFSWTYVDTLNRADSFYVGIDTLWLLPQDVPGAVGESNDWDLQFCPNGRLCLGGLVSGVHGANAPDPFPWKLEPNGPDLYATEHHVQFFPALRPVTYQGMAPDSAIFGGLMYVKSRMGRNRTDTVFVFGSWKLPWDDAYPPPARPVNGYLPRRGDFTIVDGKIRYAPAGM